MTEASPAVAYNLAGATGMPLASGFHHHQSAPATVMPNTPLDGPVRLSPLPTSATSDRKMFWMLRSSLKVFEDIRSLAAGTERAIFSPEAVVVPLQFSDTFLTFLLRLPVF